MNYKVITGNNIDILKTYPDNHFDSIVTDPPYGIEFLGKDWDTNTGAIETWQECLRVLKPGGYILAFSAARTYHHLATNIESVGFEIRDQIMWIYGSGFPKAQDVGKAIQRRQGVAEYEEFVDTTKNAGFGMTDHARVRAGVEWSTKETQVGKVKCTSPEAQQWAGWKTALKPAHEPIVMARKPFKGSCVDNVLEHGVGALNIDATRIGDEVVKTVVKRNEENTRWYGHRANNESLPRPVDEIENQGRFPSNVIGEISDDYQKYFYCPKVSRAERHTGFDALSHIPTIGNNNGNPMAQLPGDKNSKLKKVINQSKALGNNHPTVKPVDLMRYLITLVTPPGGHVLDPFNGSGSTGMAAVELGYEYTGCELDPAYADIARKRIEAWYYKTDISGHELPTEWFDEVN